jgi:hypothetical protein
VSKESEKTILRGGRYITMATQLPFSAVAGYALGYGLDVYFGTTWLRVVVMIVAIIGAFGQLVRQLLKDQKSK